MSCNGSTLQVHILGQICPEFGIHDLVGHATICVVPIGARDSALVSRRGPGLNANWKRIIRRIDEKAFKALHGDSAETNEGGQACFSHNYAGQPLAIYARIDRVPMPSHDDDAALRTPEYLFLGNHQPIAIADAWHAMITIPKPIWCRIKRRADAWTIAGRVTDCGSNVPLSGVKITAFDTDVVQDDSLGAATSDRNGVFRIDYPGSAYRKGTILDVELIGGPDVYFRVEDARGNPLLEEPRARGRKPGRSNASPCMCVTLCAEAIVPSPGVTAWTGIGDAFTIPEPTNLKDFDAQGYAGAAKYALTGHIRMRGTIAWVSRSNTSAPATGFVDSAGNPVRYRFLVSSMPTSNTLPPTPATGFTRVVGGGPSADKALFVPVKVGELVRSGPVFKKIDLIARMDDVDADGWLDLNKSILRTFLNPSEQQLGPSESPLTIADLNDFEFSPLGGALMAIDTNAITKELTPPDPVAGVAMSALTPIERAALRFEVMSFDDTTNTQTPMPGHGTQLDAMVVNNTIENRPLAMTEHLSSTACTPLSGNVHVAYTVHHPLLRNVDINVRSNDGAYDEWLIDTSLPTPNQLPLISNSNPLARHLHNAALPVPPAGLKKCTYLVKLTVTLRKHTGDSADLPSVSETTFYWEP